MARYEFVKGLPVITVGEGRQIGKVDKLVVDPETKSVSWFRLHSGGIGIVGGAWLWVPAAAVHGIGEHALTINSEADARPAVDAPEGLALHDAKRGIIGNTVITKSGVRLGEVRDYEFDVNTFALTFLSVPAGTNGVGDVLRIAGDRVVTIGEDAIIVAEAAAAPPAQTPDLGMLSTEGDPVLPVEEAAIVVAEAEAVTVVQAPEPGMLWTGGDRVLPIEEEATVVAEAEVAPAAEIPDLEVLPAA